MQTTRPPATFQFNSPPHIMVVQSCFYEEIAALQLKGVLGVLERVQATHELLIVPGALEIAPTISFAMKAMDFDPLRRRCEGYIALGCVLKGDTMHDEIVGYESARALQDLAITRALAIGNGILTCQTVGQALERANPAGSNRGAEAAEACLRMVEIKQYFRLSPKRRWVAK